ncbi:MAG: HTTM domain-containing protein [Ilumatobacter sp.]|nr:HTTM domain-containing protein [Ilumatobacter sp.]
MNRVDEFLGRPVSTRSLGVVRILVGAVTVMHLWPLLRDALGGDTYHDHFHHHYIAWMPELGPAGFTVLLAVGVIAALCTSLGAATRVATATTFGVVAYHLVQSTTHVHNNRAYLVAVLLILAMAPAGRSFSVDAWLAARRGAPLEPTAPAWPLWLLRFECALVYAASGFSKLIDPDWFGGAVTWGRVAAQEAMVRDSLLPDLVVDLLVDRSFHTFAAKFIVLTELFIAAGLWWRRTRPAAIVVAIVFHIMIELSAQVQVFSYLALSVLFVWAEPALPRRPAWIGHDRRMRGRMLRRGELERTVPTP